MRACAELIRNWSDLKAHGNQSEASLTRRWQLWTLFIMLTETQRDHATTHPGSHWEVLQILRPEPNPSMRLLIFLLQKKNSGGWISVILIVNHTGVHSLNSRDPHSDLEGIWCPSWKPESQFATSALVYVVFFFGCFLAWCVSLRIPHSAACDQDPRRNLIWIY